MQTPPRAPPPPVAGRRVRSFITAGSLPPAAPRAAGSTRLLHVLAAAIAVLAVSVVAFGALLMVPRAGVGAARFDGGVPPALLRRLGVRAALPTARRAPAGVAAASVSIPLEPPPAARQTHASPLALAPAPSPLVVDEAPREAPTAHAAAEPPTPAAVIEAPRRTAGALAAPPPPAHATEGAALVEALLLRLSGSRPFPSDRSGTVPGAYKADDGDVVLLLPDETAASVFDVGLDYRSIGTHAAANDADSDGARRALERDAEVAIVVVSKPRRSGADYVSATVASLMDELGGGTARCDAGAGTFRGRVHLYVYDASPPEEGAAPHAAFHALRAAYASARCATFLPADAYVRITERAPPPHGRGVPEWQADNRGKNHARAHVAQTLDFVAALAHAVTASPAAHVLVWEDDCHACPGTLSTLSGTVDAVEAFDPPWGGLKVGNGGSGMLFHARVAAPLVLYLVARRGSDNVDVSMWRFLHSGAYPDYLARETWSAHRGILSSFGGSWKSVACGNALDWYWGWYRDCEPARMTAAAAAAAAPAADVDRRLGDIAAKWRCSVWSPASEKVMPPSP